MLSICCRYTRSIPAASAAGVRGAPARMAARSAANAFTMSAGTPSKINAMALLWNE